MVSLRQTAPDNSESTQSQQGTAVAHPGPGPMFLLVYATFGKAGLAAFSHQTPTLGMGSPHMKQS